MSETPVVDTDPMAGVSPERIQLQVTAGQYAQLERDQIQPGRPRVTHKIAVGPFYLPGFYVVVGAQRHQIPSETTYWVQLSKVDED